MILQFKTDTLLLNDTNGATFGFMSYKISNDTLSILNLSGESDCSYSEYATYLVEIKGKKLTIKPLNNNCYDRENSWA